MPDPRPLSPSGFSPLRAPLILSGWLAPCLALSLSGCLGDQLGGGAMGLDCVEKERRELSLDEESPLGVRARDILDFAATSFEVPLGWSIPEEYSGLELTPRAGDTTLHLKIAERGARATYVVQEDPFGTGQNPRPQIAVHCPDYLEIETEVELRTDNGAFDDTLPIVLQAHDIATASAVIPLESGAMAGSFELNMTGDLEVESLERQPTSWKRGDTKLSLSLSPERISGAMTSYYTIFWDNDLVPAASAAEIPFGRLESEQSCYADDFGGRLDGGEAVSRLLTRLAGPPRLAFGFDGTLPDVELEASIEASRFCLGSAESFSPTHLGFAAEVALVRPGGEVFATWPLRGSASYATDGAFDHVVLFFEPPLGDPLPVTEAVRAMGDFGADFGDADFVALGVELKRDDETNWAGKLTLQTARARPASEFVCETEPRLDENGDLLAGGCPGPLTEYELAAEATITEVPK